MHHETHLRELSFDIDCEREREALEPRTASAVRLAALVAAGAPLASIHREVDTALGAGLRPAQLVAMLDELIPVVGRPRVVAAAPLIGQALGLDLDPDPENP